MEPTSKTQQYQKTTVLSCLANPHSATSFSNARWSLTYIHHTPEGHTLRLYSQALSHVPPAAGKLQLLHRSPEYTATTSLAAPCNRIALIPTPGDRVMTVRVHVRGVRGGKENLKCVLIICRHVTLHTKKTSGRTRVANASWKQNIVRICGNIFLILPSVDLWCLI